MSNMELWFLLLIAGFFIVQVIPGFTTPLKKLPTPGFKWGDDLQILIFAAKQYLKLMNHPEKH